MISNLSLLSLFLLLSPIWAATCNHDDCYRNFENTPTPASSFCATFTTAVATVSTGYPSFIPSQCQTATRLSSACSCVIGPQTATTSTSTSSSTSASFTCGPASPTITSTSTNPHTYTFVNYTCGGQPYVYFSVYRLEEVETPCDAASANRDCAIAYCANLCDGRYRCVQFMVTHEFSDAFWQCSLDYKTTYDSNTGAYFGGMLATSLSISGGIVAAFTDLA